MTESSSCVCTLPGHLRPQSASPLARLLLLRSELCLLPRVPEGPLAAGPVAVYVSLFRSPVQTLHFLDAGFFVAGSVFCATRCFLLPVFGVAAVFSVAGKAGFVLLWCLRVAANAVLSVAGLVFYVAALVLTVAGTACIVATWCFMCPHGVLCCRNPKWCFFAAATPAGTHEGSDVTSRCFVLPDFLAVSTRVPGDRISWLSRDKTSRTKRCGAPPLNRTFWSGRSLLSLPAARLPPRHAFAVTSNFENSVSQVL